MEPAGSSPRARQRAALAPLFGAFLLLPPFVWLFAGERTVFGVPLIVAYLFGVWLLLIAVTWWLTWRLGAEAAPHAAPEPQERAPPDH